MGKTSRTKGRRFQSDIARWLREVLGIGNYQSTQGMETRRGNIGDVVLEDPEAKVPLGHGYVVQTKKGKRPSVWKAMKEAVAGTTGEPQSIPVAIVHRDAKKPGQPAERLICMRPQDWSRLARARAVLEGKLPPAAAEEERDGP